MTYLSVKDFLRTSVNLLPGPARGWVKHIPIVASTQRWLVNRVLSGEAFVHTINAGPARGLQFEVTLPNDKAIWSGTFEREFTETLRQGVRRGDICYDIGGYRGYTAGVMALAGAERVVVCEPLPENVAALQRLVQLNPSIRATIEQVAVGKTDGPATFKVMPDQSMGKLADSPFQKNVPYAREINVELVCLDTLIFERGLPAPSVIKIDVEGAEVDVLHGAVRALTEFRPKLLIEAHSDKLAVECIRLLRGLRYSAHQLELGRLAPAEPRHLVATPA